MDPKNPNRDSRSSPQYGLYQRENFWKSNDGQVPPFNTGIYPHAIGSLNNPAHALLTTVPDPRKLEELAKAKLTENGWYYASSNAG